MADPVVFVVTNRIKEGKRAGFEAHYRNSVPAVETGKPGMHAQLAYVDEEGTAFVVVRLFASAEALDAQLQGADERSRAAYRYIAPVRVEIYGAPSEFALEMIEKVAGPGVDVRVYPDYAGGFLRPHSAGATDS
jgi:quinol monooxygenase YgiN